jgi:UDP-2,4-diacetamido-2,4,6-trideoxy-beta-L-altropyranose hydrolase
VTKVTFVTAASPRIGGGHVLRCLALAESLAGLGAEVRFATDRVTRDTVGLLGTSGFAVVETPPAAAHGHAHLRDTDIVIFDGYDFDIAVERRWRGVAPVRVAIDDLANRPHDCGVLLDHAVGRMRAHYEALVPSDCVVLAGPDYALMRPEFRALRSRALARRHAQSPQRVLIAMGLTDVCGVSRRAVEGVRAARMALAVDVVTGRTATSLPWLEEQARAGTLRLHVDLEARGMADLMAEADIAIGGGGGTSLERCCLGLPSLIIVVADNQLSSVASLVREGAATSLGVLDDATPRRIARALDSVDGEGLAAQARAAARIVDGEGAGRVGRVVLDRLAAAR